MTCEPNPFASRTAHLTAAVDGSDPSTPTTMRRMPAVLVAMCASFLCVAEMRYHLAEARFLEVQVQRRQMRTHPFPTLLDDFLPRLLVLTCGHGDQHTWGVRHPRGAE